MNGGHAPPYVSSLFVAIGNKFRDMVCIYLSFLHVMKTGFSLNILILGSFPNNMKINSGF